MSTPSTGWEGILADGETILWQGRPAPGIVWRDLINPLTFFGLFFFLFAVFWVGAAFAMTRNTGGGFGILFPLFGLPFIAVGFYLLIGRIFWDAYSRSRTWYTLTDRGAYTATEIFGKRALKRVGFDEMSRLDLEDSQPGSVWFSETVSTHAHRRRGSAVHNQYRSHSQTTVTPVGFARIDDPRAVYRLIADRRRTERS